MEYVPPGHEKVPDLDAIVNAPEVELTVVVRKGWDAKDAVREVPALQLPVQNVVMAYNTEVAACFTTDECKVRMRELQQLHMDRGLADIHYNFAIGTDGNIYEGRGWNLQPERFMERPELDEKSICIGVIGDGKERNLDQPLELITAVYFANHGVDEGYVVNEYEVCEDTQTFDIKPPA